MITFAMVFIGVALAYMLVDLILFVRSGVTGGAAKDMPFLLGILPGSGVFSCYIDATIKESNDL
jgi:hypothetical protein